MKIKLPKFSQKFKIKIFLPLFLPILACSLFTTNSTTPRVESPQPEGTSPPAKSTSTPPTGFNPTGPYVVFSGSDGIWITNPDGSFPTRLTDSGPAAGDLHQLLSPSGDRLVYVAQNETGLDLTEVKIPSGEVNIVSRLLDITFDEVAGNPTSAKAIAYYAIKDYDSLAWQPESGQLLAFTGAMDGPSADLYLYDFSNVEITRLTDGPSQAIFPTWSPNGEYILHYGVSWTPPFGGAIVGYNRLDGVYAVRISDGEVIDQPEPIGERAAFDGWWDDTHYITHDTDVLEPLGCYTLNLRTIDVATLEAQPVMDYSFSGGLALSPRNRAMLFSGSADCFSSPGEGVYLLIPGSSVPQKLHDTSAYEASWLPESEVFHAYPRGLFSADRQTVYDPPVTDKSFHPAISKQGYQAWEVIENFQGRVVVKDTTRDWRAVLENISVAGLIWDPIKGDTLLISLQDGSLYKAAYPDFTPRLQGDLGKRIQQAIWVP